MKRWFAPAALAALALRGTAAQADEATKPTWLVEVRTTRYDGKGDDLVTAGFGAASLSAETPVVRYADPLHPTAAELRHAAIAAADLPRPTRGSTHRCGEGQARRAGVRPCRRATASGRSGLTSENISPAAEHAHAPVRTQVPP